MSPKMKTVLLTAAIVAAVGAIGYPLLMAQIADMEVPGQIKSSVLSYRKGRHPVGAPPAFIGDAYFHATTEGGNADGAPLPPAQSEEAVLDPLDMNIPPAVAEAQAQRIAAARHLPETRVRGLIHTYTESPFFGLWGKPHVNLRTLNLALDDVTRSN